MADDRLEQLERRIAALEKLVRQLLAPGVTTRAVRAPDPEHAPTNPAELVPPPPSFAAPPTAPRVRVRPRVEVAPTPPARTVDWEQWVGQRGLLVVGLLALLATGGFFLNYAIQHGWIPPIVRASLAVVAGIALAVWGDRLVQRGMLGYGAAIIGGGGGLVYLGIWAAAGPYALLSREIGVLLLAATSGIVVALAIRHGVEGLAIWALAGAYFAPIFLASSESVAIRFLAYLAVVGTTFMLLAERMSWRATFNTALFGFLLLPAAVMANELNTPLGVNYGVLAAVVALLATGPGRSPWPEARIWSLLIVWTLLFAVTGDDALRWTALAGGALITTIVWWQQLRQTPFSQPRPNDLSPEAIVYLTPIALVVLAALEPPGPLERWGGVVPLAFGALYLSSGWIRNSAHLTVMGFALIALAISGQWDRAAVAAGWAILATLACASGRWARRSGAYEVGAAVALCAFGQLFTIALASPNTPVFLGVWSLAWYACVVGFALCARWWDSRTPQETGIGLALWSLTALTVLLGGSIELFQVFDLALFPTTLALVFYWLLFALALVRGSALWKPRKQALARRTAWALLAGAYALLFAVTLDARSATDRAFVGLWSVGWYACCAAPVLATRWWLPAAGAGRAALWWMAGACVLLGGSIELHRAFTSELAGDLAISTFWLVYAAALVRAGFWLDRKVVRSAGLGVAALAALKILLYDLSALQALYRVGSFFVLALITLAVAYAYNKRAKEAKASAT